MTTTIGANLAPEDVALDSNLNDENEPLRPIIPSPNSIGLHPPTAGERAFDALLSKPSFDHSHAQAEKENVVVKTAEKRGLRNRDNRLTVGDVGPVTTPVMPRATRSARK
jgi:hypothetical protein